MRILPFAFIFFISCLSAKDAVLPYLTSECDSLVLVDGIVNVQNGKLVQISKDIEIPGSDPLEVTRFYDGGHHFSSNVGYGIGLGYPIVLTLTPNKQMYVELRRGLEVLFNLEKHKTKGYVGTIVPEFFNDRYTNCPESLLNGEPSILTMRVEGEKDNYCVKLGDGTERHYIFYREEKYGNQYFRLRYEKRPNGNIRHFKYTHRDVSTLRKIETTNVDKSLVLNWISFEYSDNQVHITASNGQSVVYQLEQLKGLVNAPGSVYADKYYRKVLISVSGEHLSKCDFEYSTFAKFYSTLFSIFKVKNPDGRFIEVDYSKYTNVKRLYLSGETRPQYEFDYHKFHTSVEDAFGTKKQYHFDRSKRLVELKEANCVHEYSWDKIGQLKRHSIFSSNHQLICEQSYQYNSSGKVSQVKVKGAVSKKGNLDIYVVDYKYSDGEKNLLLIEEHNGEKVYLYSYQDDTNLLASKITKVGQIIQEREFYQYDTNSILVSQIIDDGSGSDKDDLTNVTFRKVTEILPQLDPNVPGLTLPKVMLESYDNPKTGQRILLKKIERSYTKEHLLSEERVYDANDNYCYSLYYEYDLCGQLTKETNPLGESTIYAYDANGNKIYEEVAGSGKSVRYGYDSANRLISEVEQHSRETLNTTHEYDVMGNRISTTDCYGQKATYKYDNEYREISRTDPLGLTEAKAYDSKGHVKNHVDKDGFSTQTINNLYGSPFEIKYQDGTTKSFEYDLKGHLVQEWNRDGTYIKYKLDYQGRQIEARTHDSNGKELITIRHTYKGPNLISETDAMGNITQYQYDGAGRQTAKIQQNIITTYSYDALGRLSNTITDDRNEIKKYDYLDRTIEERIEDLNGNIFSKIQYEYDVSGNCIVKREFSDSLNFAETTTLYNSENQPIKIIDSLGYATLINYFKSDHLEKETIEPNGRKTHEIFDPLLRLKEKKVFSSLGELLAQTRFTYDGRGNKILHNESIIHNKENIGYYSINYHFDGMGQLLSETEQNTKTTSYTYSFGRLQTIQKPDGVILTHHYDPLGRLNRLVSSDATIDYLYRYDLNGNLLEITDQVSKTSTKRSYDSCNRLIQETLGTEFVFSFSYDKLHRLTDLSFLDRKISYSYSPTQIISASCSQNDQLLCTYSQSHDWRNGLIKAVLPNHAEVAFERDKKGRCVKIDSPNYQQTLTYDKVGNLIQSSISDFIGLYENTFTYDGLDQLIDESGAFSNTYQYDSLHNRRLQNNIVNQIDPLNQLTNDGLLNYQYDLNGRRTAKSDAIYTYDALGRLISFKEGDTFLNYQYDSFGRRLKCTTPNSTLYYLYQIDNEIGVFDEHLKEFRLLNSKSSPVSIELEGEIYSPIKNHRGDICQLLDSAGIPVTVYRYDSFGKYMQHGNKVSSWLFSGQRYDKISETYHYDKREYDPAVGRWLTPDPLGFVDGPNLYAYVNNNPLTFVDPHGLLMVDVGTNTRPRKSWGTSYHSFRKSLTMVGGAISNIQKAYRKFKANEENRKEAFKRGFIDDMSFGASDYVLGEHHNGSWDERLYYGAGTMASLGVGALYGSTEIKAGKLALNTLFRGGSYFGKSLNKSKRFSKLFPEANPSFQKMSEILKDVNVPKRVESVVEEVGKKSGRHRFVPDANAVGQHSVYRKNACGTTTHYETYAPQTNPKNPNPWESVIRYDNSGKVDQYHFNKVFKEKIYEPHIHDPFYPGGVRNAEAWEIPR